MIRILKSATALMIILNLSTIHCWGQCQAGACSINCNACDQQLTLPLGSYNVTLEGTLLRFKPFSDEFMLEHADLQNPVYSYKDQFTTSLIFTASITDRIEVKGMIPFNGITSIRTALPGSDDAKAVVQPLGNCVGIGDVTMLLEYAVYRDKDNGWDALLRAGIKLPTGQNDVENNEGVPFALKLQPGMYVFQPVFGVAGMKKFTRWRITAQLNTMLKGGSKSGHVMGGSVNASLMSNISIFSSSGMMLDLLAGAEETAFGKMGAQAYNDPAHNHQHNGYTGGYELLDPNSGGNYLQAVAGCTFTIHHSISIPLRLGMPVLQSWNGKQVPLEFNITTGCSINF